MGQWGEAFGVPFAFEGLFFFTEAIFVSIYIFGWRRLKPWTHFWTGVPIVLAGIFGGASVVAANAWMNSPSGFTLERRRRDRRRRPVAVIFNDAMPLMAAHMIVAAYVVGGFLVASVYAVGMLRGRRDRYHRLGFIIAFTVAAIAMPIQMGVGDSLARWVYNNQPMKFAAIELVPTTSSDVPETLLGHLNDDGTVSGGIPIPGLASWLSDPSTGTATVDPGSRHGARRRAADDPAGQHRAPRLGRHGRARARSCSCCRSGTGSSWMFRRDMPKSRWFLRIAAVAGRARRHHDGGGLGRERGRPPAVDRLRPT